MTNPTEKVIINPTEKLRGDISDILQIYSKLSESPQGCSIEQLEQFVAQILQACKEGVEIEGITYRLKFVPEIWRLPFQALNPKVKDQFLNLVMNEINSQTKDIEL